MKPKSVSYTLEALPPLTEDKVAELRNLADSKRPIDFSDIPESKVGVWAEAERGKFFRPVKQQITARLDADVLAWLKRGGPGYQQRMNAILRGVMLGVSHDSAKISDEAKDRALLMAVDQATNALRAHSHEPLEIQILVTRTARGHASQHEVLDAARRSKVDAKAQQTVLTHVSKH